MTKITFLYKEDNKKHKGKLYGKITIEKEEFVPKGLFVILTGERNYYTASVDSLGNYKIENVASGNYQLFISVGSSGMLLIDDVKVDGEKKYNFTIKESQKEKLEEMIVRGVGGNEMGDVVFESSEVDVSGINSRNIAAPKAVTDGLMMKKESKR